MKRIVGISAVLWLLALSGFFYAAHKNTPKTVAAVSQPTNVDTPDFIQTAVETLQPYLDDHTLAPLEAMQIQQVEQDIVDLTDSSLATPVMLRREKLVTDFNILKEWDDALQRVQWL